MEKLHTVTRAEFNRFPIVNGTRICPTANYSNLSDFSDRRCSFESGSRFRAMSKFSSQTRFGNNCVFGKQSHFEYCTFGTQCRFLPTSYFYKCDFGSGCTFAHGCKFHICEFENPLFGSACYFNDRKAVSCMPMVKISGGIFDTLYLFNTVDGVYAQNSYFVGPFAKLANLTREEYVQQCTTHFPASYQKSYLATLRKIQQLGTSIFAPEEFEPKEQLVLPLTVH